MYQTLRQRTEHTAWRVAKGNYYFCTSTLPEPWHQRLKRSVAHWLWRQLIASGFLGESEMRTEYLTSSFTPIDVDQPFSDHVSHILYALLERGHQPKRIIMAPKEFNASYASLDAEMRFQTTARVQAPRNYVDPLTGLRTAGMIIFNLEVVLQPEMMEGFVVY